MEIFLNKNGSFVERRKMYIGFPQHNMSSNIQFNWLDDNHSSQNYKGKQKIKQKDLEKLTKVYNETVEKQLDQKYKAALNHYTFRSIPNQLTLQRDRDSLMREIQNFNQSKLQPNSAHSITNPEAESQTLVKSYEEQYPEHFKKRSLQEGDTYTPRLDHRESQLNSYNYYGYDLMKQYSKFNELKNGAQNSVQRENIFKNVMPDKLESFLREKTKRDRVKAINVSLSLARRQKSM